MYKDLDSFIRGEQDPDIFYFFIKQAIKNMNNGITVPLLKEKEYKVNLVRNLEVFRSIMQYIEEFGIYFLAYVDKSSDLASSIVRTDPKKLKPVFEKFIQGDHDDFAKDKSYSGFSDLLENVFHIQYSSTPKEKNKAFDNLKKGIDKIAWFFLYYSSLYNSIKHGSRVFPQNYNRVDVIDDKNKTVCSININEDYFEAVCKDSGSGDIYVLIYPVDILTLNSIRVLEDTHEIFNYLRKTNKYKKPLNFEYEVAENILKYRKAYNEDYSLYLPNSIELDKISSNGKIKYSKISVKGNEIQFSLNDKRSTEYPFIIEVGADYGYNPKPGTQSDLKISSNLYMDVEQYLNLIKIKELSKKAHDNLTIVFVNDKTGKKLSKKKYGDLEFPFLPSKYNREIVELLVKLKWITHEMIPVPEYMSKSQYKLLNSNINEKWTLDKAKNLLKEIKNAKNEIVSFNVKKIDPKGNKLPDQFLGTSEKLDSYHFTVFDENLKSKEVGIKELIGKTFKTKKALTNPYDFIKGLESSLTNTDPTSYNDKEEFNDNEFGMQIEVKINEEYWYNEYAVEITIEFRDKI